MAKTGKELFDELETIYSIAEQSIYAHRNDGEKLQQIAACSALFAMKLAKDTGFNVIDAAPFIPYWIWRIMNSGNSAFDEFQLPPLPKGLKSSKRSDGVRQGGIDYTSQQVIHKIIDPLFLNDLKEEFAAIKDLPPSETKRKKLLDFQDELASIVVLDPACGCGNFLVESYVSLRELENQMLAELKELNKVELPP